MKRTPIALLVAAAVLASIAATTNHSASPAGRYLAVYERVDQANAGPYEGGLAGRNLVADGVHTKHGSRPATDEELEAARHSMHQMIHPRPVAPAPAPRYVPDGSAAYIPPTPPAPAPTSSGGCPSYMAAEASSPDAVNPDSGAAGCYQIIPSTQAAYGCASPDAACAAAICADVGASAWQASGANPCPYVQP